MLAYGWPGNVRQLRSAVRRAVLMAEDVITEDHDKVHPFARASLFGPNRVHSSSEINISPLSDVGCGLSYMAWETKNSDATTNRHIYAHSDV